jgi:hypothetical protein
MKESSPKPELDAVYAAAAAMDFVDVLEEDVTEVVALSDLV